MFAKKPHAANIVKKSTQKLIDPKKDTWTRLKHLRIILDFLEVNEVKAFFEQYHHYIFFVFYDVFIQVEANLRQRAHKTHREELEVVLLIFEKILLFLPELIHKQWQFHSIGRLTKKLLHPENTLKLRKEAIRLFLIWYQILGGNASNELDLIYACMVPGFPNPSNERGVHSMESLVNDSAYSTSSVFHDCPISSVENPSMLPIQSGDKQLDDQCHYLLESLLEYSVSQVLKVEWKDKEQQINCFDFLFEKFKQFYLPHIFPHFSFSTNLYQPVLELPEPRKLSEQCETLKNGEITQCQVAVIRWICLYTHDTKKSDTLQSSINSPNITDTLKDIPEGENEEGSNNSESSQNLLTVNTSGGSGIERVGSSPSINSEERLGNTGQDIVRQILYSSRNNVNLIHEIFRQAFFLPPKQAPAIRRVLIAYKEWFQTTNISDAPLFIHEPIIKELEHRAQEASNVKTGVYLPPFPSEDALDRHLKGGTIRKANDVRAGLQNMLQLFLTNTCHIFLLNGLWVSSLHLNEHIDICRRVLSIYRYIVMNIPMHAKTWEQLMLVLMKVTSYTLKEKPPVGEKTLGTQLASILIQTTIVTWIRANLNVHISTNLWDHFLNVLSSLTLWEECIQEWSKIMDTLTRSLARHVYKLELFDLPLDRLTGKEKRQRKGKPSDSNKPGPNTFERGFSRYSGPPAIGGSLEQEVNNALAEREAANSDIMLRPKADTGRVRSASGGGVPQELTRPLSLQPSTTVPLIRSTSDGDIGGRDSPNSLPVDAPPPRGRLSDDPQILKALALDHGECTNIDAQDESSHCEDDDEVYNGDEKDFNTHDDAEVTSISVSMDTKSIDSMALTADRSDKCSSRDVATPSPPTIIFDEASRSRSRTTSCTSFETAEEEKEPSLAETVPIDVVENLQDDNGNFALFIDPVKKRSVIAGGCVQGWVPEAAVILWQRMMGCLGNPNKIRDPKIHAQVLTKLCDLYNTMLKIRLNQGVTIDNQTSPAPPEYIPPSLVFSPWLFEAILTMPDEFKQGKLIAYKLLCLQTCQRHDQPLDSEYLLHLYKVLHKGLISSDQDTVNTIVRHCSSRFFSICLPGSTMLLLDFIHAANLVVSSTGLKEEPRTEAIVLLGSLLCFPNLFGTMPVIQPNQSEPSIMECADAKDYIISILLKCGRKEPAGLARCIAISTIGIFLYEELSHGTFHSKLKEAFSVLLLALRFNNKSVVRVASDSLLMLCDHAALIVDNYPELPGKIIRDLSTAISSLLISDPLSGGSSKKLIVLMMMTLLEWCIHLPLFLLTQSQEKEGKSLLLKVFKVLNIACTGTGSGLVKGSQSIHSLSELTSYDCDPNIQLDNVKGLTPPSTPSKSASLKREQTDEVAKLDIVKLTARTVMCYLVNHLGHFPMGAGPSMLSSMVNEHDDVPGVSTDELSPEIFNSSRVQFFVLNNSILVSFVEIPSLEQPGGGVTAGLITASSQVRVVIRDISGKACWDASPLYAPPDYKHGLYPSDLKSSSVDDPISVAHKSFVEMSAVKVRNIHVRDPNEIPTYELSNQVADNLAEMLVYIGHTSPECLLFPDQSLNIAAPPQEGIPQHLEAATLQTIVNQCDYEMDYYKKHQNDVNIIARMESAIQSKEPSNSFHQCRRILCQLGYMSWEKRAEFDLLSKNEKLLRELRNLDQQKCRETHKMAVIYVAEGQEDKNSLLSNAGGSLDFENFVAGLGWEVDLGTHPGFMGGLQTNKTTGDTAPYYATSTVEVIFHVSTRFPSNTDEHRHVKLRHLGNDEVHIVWSEHSRDYRRGIIATEFGDVMIVIYPLPNLLYRIQICKKQEIPYFGPLFDGAIVDAKVLPGLVRATAINASRVKRSIIPLYQTFYEERAKYVDNIAQKLKEPTSFEEFTAKVYSPSSRPQSQVQSGWPSVDRHDVSTLASALLDSKPSSSPSPSSKSSASSSAHPTLHHQPTITYGMIGDQNNLGDEVHIDSAVSAFIKQLPAGTKGRMRSDSTPPCTPRRN